LLKLKSEDQIVEQQRPHVPEYFEQGWKQKEGDLRFEPWITVVRMNST